MTTFKDGFLWGGAVAAHQLEGKKVVRVSVLLMS